MDVTDEPSTSDGLSRAVGTAVRLERAKAGWSMRKLAGLAGVSQPFLSNVENGRIYPSVPTLYALAAALGVAPAQLMPPTESSRSAGVHLPATDGTTDTAQILSGGPGKALESFLFDVAPGYADATPFAHDGEDFIYVLEGVLQVWIGDTAATELAAGESLWIDGALRHGMRVPVDATGRTRVLLVSSH